MLNAKNLRMYTLASLCLLAGADLASAHAKLDGGQPAAGSVLSASPSAVRLTFTERLDVAFSGLTITDDADRTVPLSNATVDGPGGMQLVAPLEGPLRAGGYHVNWHVLSVDGHRTTGSYDFSVRP